MFPLKSQKLDSSIKRNTGFIKRLKQGINKESKQSLLKDLSEVSLEKYLSEITNTAAEGLSNVGNKNEDVIAAVEVVSGLHQRFNARFTCGVFELFLNNFTTSADDSTVDKEGLAKASKLKGNLRVLTELYLVGIFTSLDKVNSKEALPPFLQRKVNKKEPLLLPILKETLNYKFKLGFSTAIATSFVKRFPFFFDNEDTSLNVCIFDYDLKGSLQALFKVFTEAVFARALELDSKVKKLYKEHQKCQFRTGKSTDEYIEEYNFCLPIYESFKTASENLAEFFQLNLPAFGAESDARNEETSSYSPVITNTVALPGQRVWENEETRKFYEILPNIDDVYTESLRNTTEANGDAINRFFASLEGAETKEMIDSLSVQYWATNLDNKATRKRLLKFLIETQDWSKIRIFARYLATNAKYLPEVIEEFITYLDNGFRSQLHSNRINVKNIIFFSEMVKFMLLPTYMIFHKIRTLIINLQVPNNIEILTVFFEHLGIFLINKPEYKQHMEKMVELIKENKKDRQLNINLKGALDNLINLVYPPSIRSLNADAKILTSEQKFYRVLIRRELGNFEHKHVIKLLRKANWKDPNVYNMLRELLTKPEEISYQNIPLMARVLKELYAYQRNFVITCIDEVIENIERGLEISDYSKNMQRISEVRYLTELYNCELIKPVVLIDSLFRIMSFGHARVGTNLFSPTDIDRSDDYFRIQLISTVLLHPTKTSPTFRNKTKLFLMFFDYYISTKDQPIPQEVNFKLDAIFEKFMPDGGIHRSASTQESAMRLFDALKTQSAGHQGGKSEFALPRESSINLSEVEYESANEEDEVEFEKDDVGSDISGLIDDEEDEQEDQHDHDQDESDSDSDGDDEEDSEEESSEEEDIYRDIDADRDIEKKRMYEEFQRKMRQDDERKIEAEMERQFQQILLESADSRKNEKVTGGKIPILSSKNESDKPELLRPASSRSREQSNKIAFTFLSRSGKKTQSRVLGLPSNVEFVSGVLEEEERLKNEREKIKKIVLQRTFD